MLNEGSDLHIQFYCAKTGNFAPPYASGGGAEEALTRISASLAQRGMSVTVFSGDVDRDTMREDVCWKPLAEWNEDASGIVIMWRYPSLIEHSDLRCSKARLLDLHEAISPERIARNIDRLDGVLFKSEFHRSLYPHLPDDKAFVVPNPVLTAPYMNAIPREQMLIVNTAFPARSLTALVGAFEQIRSRVPDATLAWAYGWETYDRFYGDNSFLMKRKEYLRDKMRDLGIQELGRIGEPDLSALYLRANIYGYPSEAAEVDCISISKAQIAGAVPISSSFGAMQEKLRFGGIQIPSSKVSEEIWNPNVFDDSIKSGPMLDAWIDATCHQLLFPLTEAERTEMRDKARLQYGEPNILMAWERVILQVLR